MFLVVKNDAILYNSLVLFRKLTHIVINEKYLYLRVNKSIKEKKICWSYDS